MNIPDKEIEHILFANPIDRDQLSNLKDYQPYLNTGGFPEIHWLNTPGPVYTTYTDNCGTGQIEAISNVGGDEDYHEVIFKQPVNLQELSETMTAAAVDPFDSYFFDGTAHWTNAGISHWWSKSEERILFILDRYKEELHLTPAMLNPLFGPRRPVPDNYKYWLDFYQFGMKEYLEWYITIISNQRISLTALEFDWTKRLPFDQLYIEKGFDKTTPR